MKELFKKIIVWKLERLAKLYLKRFKPTIVAVTGNVGKTSTKEAIATVLSASMKVRAGKGNLNNEFGVPLAILGDWPEYYEKGAGVMFWLKVIAKSFFGFPFVINYPEVLVLEYGADQPGDIKKLASKFRPDIAVVTAVGDIPVHVEFFSGAEGVAREKARLVEALAPSGHAVLNIDDDLVLAMKNKTKARISTFGFTEGATVRVSGFELRSDNNMPIGVAFKIHSGANSFVPVEINGSLGKSQAYSASAAAAVGMIMGMNLVDISNALSYYEGPKGRLKILAGIKNSWIIDDTYNSSPAACHMALDTLKQLPAGRRVAVLGDMLELGDQTIPAHQAIGDLAGSFVDVLVTVGARAKFIADSAANQMPMGNIYSFDASDSAKLKVQELIREGDLILAKGSQGMRMEKIVEEIMAEPEKRKELLVRQSDAWRAK